MKNKIKLSTSKVMKLALALGLTGSLAACNKADTESTFDVEDVKSQTEQAVDGDHKCGEGKCGGEDHKCGEGKCGGEDHKCGEGKSADEGKASH